MNRDKGGMVSAEKWYEPRNGEVTHLRSWLSRSVQNFPLLLVGVIVSGLLPRPVTAQEGSERQVVATAPRYALGGIPRCRSTAKRLSCVQVVDVYDGDTVFIDLPGLPAVFGKRIGVRILGIDTAERKSKSACEKQKAEEARRYLDLLLKNAKRVDVNNVKRDKYFRLLGDLVVDGASVSEKLIAKKLAYPYFGEAKPKRDWCREAPEE